MAASSCSRSSRYIRERPSETASRPAASGTRSTAALVEAATVDAPINPGLWNAVGYAVTHLGHGVVDTGAAAWMFVRDPGSDGGER